MPNIVGKKRKEVFFDIDDWEYIKKEAKECKLNTAEYIRKMSTECKIVNVNFEGLKNLSFEINKIGTNINQIAKKINETNSIYASDIKNLKEEFDEACLTLNQYLLKQMSEKA